MTPRKVIGGAEFTAVLPEPSGRAAPGALAAEVIRIKPGGHAHPGSPVRNSTQYPPATRWHIEGSGS